MKKVICDTNVFVHHFRNDPATVSEMAKIGSENVLLPSIVSGHGAFQGHVQKE